MVRDALVASMALIDDSDGSWTLVSVVLKNSLVHKIKRNTIFSFLYRGWRPFKI